MKRLAIILLAIVAASCSRKTDEQLYREGLDAEQRKDQTVALERYASVVGRAPATAYAESCQYRAALLLMNMPGEKRRAAHEQLRFHEMFPSSPNAPNMLFLAAFTFNNDLHKIDSARILYTLFLQKYPQDKLASSAQFELDNLGKSPDEFIRRHEVADTTARALPR